MNSSQTPRGFTVIRESGACIIRVESADGRNRLHLATVRSMTIEIQALAAEGEPMPIIVTGNSDFFSAGADLNEIAALSGPSAYDFAVAGQRLMNALDSYPAPVIAAINGYCMGGGLDLALACDFRTCSPKSIFGHRGASLGIMTGWGGTQRLPRLIGKARALQMFLCAEKLDAAEALHIALVDAVADNPVKTALDRAHEKLLETPFRRDR